MHHYLKHAYASVLFYSMTVAAVLLAPQWAFLVPLSAYAIQFAIDTGTPPDLSLPKYRAPLLLDVLLYLWVPLAVSALGSLLWLATPGDLGGIGAALEAWFGLHALAAKQAAGWPELLSAAFAVGYFLSGNMTVGHELTHRTSDRFAMLVGRWVLAMVCEAQFSISHVYGHHVNVGTAADWATARRGENLYAFAWRSWSGQYRDAWALEMRRLAGRPAAWLVNRVVSGLLMTLAIAALFAALGGARALAAYAVMVVITTFLYESVQYIEHYGLSRVPGAPVEPRHSWDCRTRASSNALINLSRHAHHHADARVKYWELEPMEGSLDLPLGYAAHSLMAMVPPLWFRFAHPQLARWDRELAAPGEAELARRHALGSWGLSHVG